MRATANAVHESARDYIEGPDTPRKTGLVAVPIVEAYMAYGLAHHRQYSNLRALAEPPADMRDRMDLHLEHSCEAYLLAAGNSPSDDEMLLTALSTSFDMLMRRGGCYVAEILTLGAELKRVYEDDRQHLLWRPSEKLRGYNQEPKQMLECVFLSLPHHTVADARTESMPSSKATLDQLTRNERRRRSSVDQNCSLDRAIDWYIERRLLPVRRRHTGLSEGAGRLFWEQAAAVRSKFEMHLYSAAAVAIR